MEVDDNRFIELSEALFSKYYDKLPDKFFTTDRDQLESSVMFLNQIQAEAISGKGFEAVKNLVLMVENLQLFRIDDLIELAEAEAHSRELKSLNGRKPKGFTESPRQKFLRNYDQYLSERKPEKDARKQAKKDSGISDACGRQYALAYRRGERAKPNK